MKRLILIGLLVLVAMIPNLVFAGNVYSPTVKATFYNEAKFTSPGLPGAKGSATITYSSSKHEWAIAMNFSGLLKNYPYTFQIGLQGQPTPYYDIEFTTDKTGKFAQTFIRNDLDVEFPNGITDVCGYDGGYTILRLFDLKGKSGGLTLVDLAPPPGGNPYEGEYPNATMVMRAREDVYRGSLVFK